jgi:uncharacterized protein YcsI (UPF0317 family)
MMKQELHPESLALEEARARIRSSEHTGPTGGLASGHVQTNLVILPEEYAFDFLKFCVRNPKPCPVLEVTDVGSPTTPVMAPDADLRTDVPKYRVYKDGKCVDEPTEITSYWQDDLMSFLIGCSFTFEKALLDAGLRLAHLDQGKNVPMYVTGRECVPSGPFSGSMVVSMRPYRPDEIPLAVAVSGRYPALGGAPLACWGPGVFGHKRPGGARVWGAHLDRRGSGTCFLGLRSHTASGGDESGAALDDHAQPRPHVHNRSPERGVRSLVRILRRVARFWPADRCSKKRQPLQWFPMGKV